jgi:hypothetical protein
MSSGGKRQFDTTEIVNRYDKRIAMTVLADFLLIGQDKVGTQTLVETRNDIFQLALGTILGEIEAVFNMYAVTRLFKLNGDDLENLPKIVHGPVSDVDIKAVVEMLERLTKSGAAIFPDEMLENEIRRRMGLPPRAEDAEPAGDGDGDE